MNIAYFCVLIASILPIFWIAIAKFLQGFRLKDNEHPRQSLEQAKGRALRAKWAHDNSWEAFAPFAAAVIIATLCDVSQSTIDLVAICFIVFRIIYGLLYIFNFPTLRSVVWTMGMVCNFILYYKCWK